MRFERVSTDAGPSGVSASVEPDDGPDRFEVIGALVWLFVVLCIMGAFGSKYLTESHDCVSGRVSAGPTITFDDTRPDIGTGTPPGSDGVGSEPAGSAGPTGEPGSSCPGRP